VKRLFPSPEALRPRPWLSRWDLLVLPLVLVIAYLLTLAFQGASVPFGPEAPDLTVDLNPANLPYYGLRTLFRMFLAILASLAFTFTYAPLAATSRRAEAVLIPALDVLQSVPILGFLTVTTAIFVGAFRGSLLGLEAASVFAIFTSQVWNMTLSFYHALVTTPQELHEAATVLRLSRWQRFWKLEVPFATPSLVWNTMMSVSGGWFFVVAAEVISVVGRDRDQFLPGIGAYVGAATQQGNLPAVGYAVLTMLILIVVYDQLFFRPIVAWAEKFKFEQSGAQEAATSWMLNALQRARFTNRVVALFEPLGEHLSLATSRKDRPGRPLEPPVVGRRRVALADRLWNALVVVAGLGLSYVLAGYLFGPGLGFAGGRMLHANPNLNVDLAPELAAEFRREGVEVGADQTVWLSSLCAATGGGRVVSPALAGGSGGARRGARSFCVGRLYGAARHRLG
jgi:NitT/TauT family transport system permease protein